jgi:hypothetical protein
MSERLIPVEALVDTPKGRDEVGTPDEKIVHCEEHDILYRKTGRCLRCSED